MRALLLPLLLLAGDEPSLPSYPLGTLPARSLTEPGRPFVLTDLAYSVASESRMEQAFFARVRFKTWGFLDAFVDGQARGGSLQTQRLSLAVFDDPSFTSVGAGWRASFVLLDFGAERKPPEDGGAWTLDGQTAFRLSPDLEAFVGLFADTDRRRPQPGRQLSEQRVALLWQRGTRLDLSAAVVQSDRRNDAGFVFETLRASAAAEGTAWNSEATLEAGYERTWCPLPREEAFANAAL
jgi:hypothetical protein